ncbi:hypothetical protein BDY24DRAFT_418062 [Mrakia frigida]|uniref:uncharacterized protein n=1 Tax=Mrakia frigida TaxID=29902 RepID=UPI003FCBF7D3
MRNLHSNSSSSSLFTTSTSTRPAFVDHNNVRSYTLGTGTFVRYHDEEELEVEVEEMKKRFWGVGMFGRKGGRKEGREEVEAHLRGGRGGGRKRAALKRLAHFLSLPSLSLSLSSSSTTTTTNQTPSLFLSSSSSLSSLLSFTTSSSNKSTTKINSFNTLKPVVTSLPRAFNPSTNLPFLLPTETLLVPASSAWNPNPWFSAPSVVLTPPEENDEERWEGEGGCVVLMNDVNLLQVPVAASTSASGRDGVGRVMGEEKKGPGAAGDVSVES